MLALSILEIISVAFSIASEEWLQTPFGMCGIISCTTITGSYQQRIVYESLIPLCISILISAARLPIAFLGGAHKIAAEFLISLSQALLFATASLTQLYFVNDIYVPISHGPVIYVILFVAAINLSYITFLIENMARSNKTIKKQDTEELLEDNV